MEKRKFKRLSDTEFDVILESDKVVKEGKVKRETIATDKIERGEG